MSFKITPLSRDPKDEICVHAYDTGGGSLSSGDRIQVRIFAPGVTVLFEEVVPEGMVWNGIHFQFQAVESPI